MYVQFLVLTDWGVVGSKVHQQLALPHGQVYMQIYEKMMMRAEVTLFGLGVKDEPLLWSIESRTC